jgi:uncharacterized protein (TIGR04255 family)
MTQPKRRSQYKTPPIEEALVEFRFEQAQEWDLTIPGKLHQHASIKDQYPGKPRQQRVLQAALQAAPGQPAGFAVHEGVGRVQLVDLDAKRLLSLGPDVLSVNVLRPYEGWDRFRPRIDAALRAYAEVAGIVGVNRIGVRYINKVVIPVTNFDLNTYLLSRPSSPPGLPNQMGGFLNRVEYAYDDGCKLLLTQASVEAPEGSSAFLLDLDVVWEGKAPLPVDEVMAVVEDLHEREGRAFEAVITDETRKVFDAT